VGGNSGQGMKIESTTVFPGRVIMIVVSRKITLSLRSTTLIVSVVGGNFCKHFL